MPCAISHQPLTAWPLSHVLQPQYRPIEIDADAVLAEELVADDATELEAEQGGGGVQIQDDHREVLVADRVEREIDARHQERVGIPTRGAVHLQRDLAADVRLAER